MSFPLTSKVFFKDNYSLLFIHSFLSFVRILIITTLLYSIININVTDFLVNQYLKNCKLFHPFQNTKVFASKRLCVFPKTQVHLLKTQVRFTSNALAFETKRTCVFRTLSKSPPEASLRPYFFVSSFSFLTGSSFFTGAERISR